MPYNALNLKLCNNCAYRQICFLCPLPLQYYPQEIQDFIVTMPSGIFKYREDARWHVDYRTVQSQIINYYNSHNCFVLGNENHSLTKEDQKESDRQLLKEQFKHFLDTAAKITEERNPALSIMFDGIGLILASDYLEAVHKTLSMLNTLAKSSNSSMINCPSYLR